METRQKHLVFIALGGVALIVAFWMLVLGPKRNEAAELGSKADGLEQSVAEQEQRVAFAQQARTEFPHNYQRLVVLGKAVPEDSDTASMLVQLNRIADGGGVQFRGIELSDSGTSVSAPPPAQPGTEAAPAASSQPSTGEPAAEPGQQAATAAAPPTEASASTLAIGASVGPAGLSVLKYKLNFRGNFFGIAKFMAGLDRLVTTGGGRVVVDGRMTTIDGFSLGADQGEGFPMLNASVQVTTYLTPSSQGLTAGATPSGPATGDQPQLTASTGGAE